MLKKYIEISVDNKCIAVCEVKECEPLDFAKLKAECQENLKSVFGSYSSEIKSLKEEITNLKKDIKFLKGED